MDDIRFVIHDSLFKTSWDSFLVSSPHFRLIWDSACNLDCVSKGRRKGFLLRLPTSEFSEVLAIAAPLLYWHICWCSTWIESTGVAEMFIENKVESSLSQSEL